MMTLVGLALAVIFFSAESGEDVMSLPPPNLKSVPILHRIQYSGLHLHLFIEQHSNLWALYTQLQIWVCVIAATVSYGVVEVSER